jgi:ribosomal protein L37AE/L43A
MSDQTPISRTGRTITPLKTSAISAAEPERMTCERCGKAEMYRMHAVWRCPECGFKTDCCGW